MCFIARDDSDLCELNGWYSRDEICVSVEVLEPSSIISSGDATLTETPVGCTGESSFSFTEERNYCIEDVWVSSVSCEQGGVVTTGTELPSSFSITTESIEDLFCMGCDNEITQAGVSGSLHHNPVRGEEGSTTTICVMTKDIYGMTSGEICQTFTVPKCRYCVQDGDTLHYFSVNYGFGARWLNLWTANNDFINNPDMLLTEGDIITLGPHYKVQPGETIKNLSERFHQSIETILDLNPDVASAGEVNEGQRLCVVPCSDVDADPEQTYTWGY